MILIYYYTRKNQYMKNFLLFAFLLFATAGAFAQMPPHPDLLKKIARGELDKSILPNYEELRAKGIDAPWADVELGKANSTDGTTRMYGPATSYATNLKALIIMVSFPDNVGKDDPKTFDTLIFSTVPGSLRSFYKENSYGKVDITTEDLPSKIGWVMAPHPYSYYVGTENGTGTYPNNSQGLVEDIIKIVDGQIDFSKYDNNGDKKVDALFIVHAGPGSEFTGATKSQIWSHAWSTRYTIPVDGVSVSRYSIEPEYMNSPGDITVGVFCHELGHALYGLPDVYDTDNSSEGLGDWSLMAGGSWNGNSGSSPAHMDAWCKIQSGFLTPKVLTNDSLSFDVVNAEFNQVAYKMWKNGVIGKEYFLIENRQKLGFDVGLPGSGLCIYHVDESQSSNKNEWYPGHTTTGHYLIAMVQADGLYTLEHAGSRGDAGDTYPGSTNNRFFNSTSFPSSLDYKYNFTNIALENITEINKVVNLNLFINDNLNPSTRTIEFMPHELILPADTIYVSVANTSLGNITISSIENSNSAYKLILPTLPKSIAANETFKVGVVFDPKAKNTYNDTIVITRPDGILKQIKISVTGKGFVQDPASEKVIYAVSNNLNNGKFATINIATGVAKNIGDLGYTDIASIAINPKTKLMYGLRSATADSAKIVKINPTQGDAYSLYKIKLGGLLSIAFDTSGTLYGVTKAGVIYKINTDSWDFTAVITASAALSSIAFNPKNNELWGSQYGIVSIRDIVYKLNLSDGVCAAIGRTGTSYMTKSIFFDEKGNLYGISSSTDAIDKFLLIDQSTGRATIVGSTGLSGLTGLAYMPGQITDVKENNEVVPYKFTLSQNYPNPFNPSTVIKYSVPKSGKVTLTVYNLLGQVVKTLINNSVVPGNYQAVWNAENSAGRKVSSGAYFYELKFDADNGNSFSDKKKMILIK
jgi:immune inhibitor A